MKFIVIIGDIVGSRKIPGRNNLQQLFQTALEKTNESFSDILRAPFYLTLGDECHGAITSSRQLFALILGILTYISPAKCRFGIGIGEISTELSATEIRSMDGSAFHRARDAVVSSKKNKEIITIEGDWIPKSKLDTMFAQFLLEQIVAKASTKYANTKINTMSFVCDYLLDISPTQLTEKYKISKARTYQLIKNMNLHLAKQVFEHIEASIQEQLI